MSSGTDEGTLSQSMRRRCLNKVKKIAGYNIMANIRDYGTTITPKRASAPQVLNNIVLWELKTHGY